MKKKWIAAGLIAAAVAGGWWYWSQSQAEKADTTPATVAVTRGAVEKTVLASGVIEAHTLTSVGARVSGQIETLAVTLGQEVTAGDLVAQIESLEQQNAVLQAQADLKQIEAQILAQQASIREAELALERKAQLNAKDLVSTEELEAAEASLAVARAELVALEAQKARAEITVSTAELDLDHTRITAPMSGTVVAIVVSEGQTVNAAQNAPTIVKIAELDRMVVKAEISEADVVQVEPGQAMTFTLLGEPDIQFHATVRDIEPAPASIEESDEIDTDEAVYYNGLFDVDNPDRKLRIGMTAEVSILLARAEDALTVLSSTLGARFEDGSYHVEVWDPATQTRETRSIEVGLNNNITAEVISGLSEGDLVISDRVSGGSAAINMGGPPSMMGF